jgi:4-amino-4-deoxy-L-arabinose transferase-like glycosyltransferase
VGEPFVESAGVVTPSFWKRQRTPVALLAVALASRIGWWASRIAVIENEGTEYVRLAENWFAGRGYVGMFGGTHVLFPPLYPGLIGPLSPALGGELSGRIVSLVSGLVLVALVYQLSRRLFGDTVGLIAGLLAAVHPLLVALSVSVYSESLAMSLVMCGAYLTVRAIETPTAWRVGGAGVAIGCAYLVRPEAIAFVGPVILAMAAAERRRGGTWPDAIRKAMVALLSAVVVALPYIAHLSLQAGHFRWEGKSAINSLVNVRMQRGMSYPEAARGLGSPEEPDHPLHRGPYLSADHTIFFEQRSPGAGDLIMVAPRRAVTVVRAIFAAFFLGAPVILGLALAGLIGST